MAKRLFKCSVAAICLLFGNAAIAQDTVTVDEGPGTLEAAIKIDKGQVVYKLTAGSLYSLDSILEVSDYTMGEGNGLVIIGEETDGMPAVIQVGVDGIRSAFPVLFQVFNNLTIKNVFLTSQNSYGATGDGILSFNDKVKVEIDNCVIDPAGEATYAFGGGDNANGSVFYLTNSLLMNNGNMEGPNDGGILSDMQWDTLWVENNTFVSSGQDFIGTPFHNIPNNNFIWINHNTFLWHDVWIKRSYNDQNFFFTNNLMHDISIFAHLYEWGQFSSPDYRQGNTMLSLTCIDTLETIIDTLGNKEYESLPSERQFFWEYNLQYNSPQLLSLPKQAVDSGYAPMYLIPMLWEDDVPIEYTGGVEVISPADSSRENRILADDVNWPLMKYNNNWYDKDPLYNNPQIYSINDSMIQNIKSWYGFVIWAEDTPFDGTPSYKYEVDRWAGTDIEEFPAVWPRFDGTYSNAELLTASIEGLPLGDLNWFPADMIRWMAEKDQIEDHILALNEERYELGPDVGIQDVYKSAAFSIFPNPARSVLHISSDTKLNSAKIFDVTGKLVNEIRIHGALSWVLDISNLGMGIYILEIETLSGDKNVSRVLKN